MAIKENPTELEPHLQILFSVIPRTLPILEEGFLPLSRDYSQLILSPVDRAVCALIVYYQLLGSNIIQWNFFFYQIPPKSGHLGSNVSSTKKDIDTRLAKAWTAIGRVSVIWESDMTDKMKRSFFQTAVVSILVYGSTTWTLTKRKEKKLDGKYIRMLRAILNKSWMQQLTKYQLYGHLLPITKTIKVRRTRCAGHCWRSRDELISDLRIIFFFIYCGLFVLILVVFVLFLLHYVSAKFPLWPSSGD